MSVYYVPSDVCGGQNRARDPPGNVVIDGYK